MKNEIHNKLKQSKKPKELESQFSQFNLMEKQPDFLQGENPIAEQRIDVEQKEDENEVQKEL